jgi:hypothetical protein
MGYVGHDVSPLGVANGGERQRDEQSALAIGAEQGEAQGTIVNP